jgi:hypothetical protein
VRVCLRQWLVSPLWGPWGRKASLAAGVLRGHKRSPGVCRYRAFVKSKVSTDDSPVPQVVVSRAAPLPVRENTYRMPCPLTPCRLQIKYKAFSDRHNRTVPLDSPDIMPARSMTVKPKPKKEALTVSDPPAQSQRTNDVTGCLRVTRRRRHPRPQKEEKQKRAEEEARRARESVPDYLKQPAVLPDLVRPLVFWGFTVIIVSGPLG